MRSGGVHEARARPGGAANVFQGEVAVPRSALEDAPDRLIAGERIVDGPVPDDDRRPLRVGEVLVSPFQQRHELWAAMPGPAR